MKIALVHLRQRQTGGTERHLDQVARHLAAGGHSVTIVCRSHEEAPHPAVRFVVLRTPALGTGWRLWAFARAVERHLARHDYDLVFALGRTWTHDVIRLGGGCHATYLESLDTARSWPSLADRLVLAIERRALAPDRVRAVVTNSEMSRQDVIARHGVAPERVTVIRNGVDLGRFEPTRHAAAARALRAASGVGANDFVVLFLGTGYRRKGLDRLLDALPLVRQTLPGVRLLAVGYDSSARELQSRAAALGLSSSVSFLGGRRDPEVCFAAADLYVLPTRYDPFAGSTLEALASGLPVITTTANGAHEILVQHRHGSILPPSAGAEQLAREISYWSDADRRRAASSEARELAGCFPEERTVRATEDLLTTVLSSKRKEVERRRRAGGVGDRPSGVSG
jgi:UDP-glucose:(heptosyl)LPS alpha-1,3-glucosyltransferase